jgi:hypothetical protein
LLKLWQKQNKVKKNLQKKLQKIFLEGFQKSYIFFPLRACDTFQCLDCCQVITLAKGDFLYPLQNNATSCEDGLLEPACRLGYNQILATTCTDVEGFNTMAVAILNSDAHSHVHKHGNYADYSPCHTLFDYRYALGLHTANHDDLTRFQSRDDYHNYVSFSITT